LVDPSGSIVGRVCHICADNPGGKRYDHNQTEEERQGFDNLILLCANHHIVVDDDDVTYTVAALRKMKQQREKSAQPFSISDETAQRVVLLMAGGAVGAGLGPVVREVRDFARLLADALSPPVDAKKDAQKQDEKLLRELDEILRYGPKGQVMYHSKEEAHLKVGAFFARIFKRSGWRVLSTTSNVRLPRGDELDRALLFMLAVKDEHQISNARQAVGQLFARCGFSPVDREDKARYWSGENAIRIFVYVGTTAERQQMRWNGEIAED